ncbi:MAG: NupC/NupG family nucleoside CNT transporter [Planctomycetota bacterium]|nr:MAG: NupC/NupG family nucleoside CNT transporter [Planctomycetota bacterium]
MAVLIGVCVLFSKDRKHISWRLVFWGLALQIVLGAFVMKTSAGRELFRILNDLVMALLGSTTEGAKFVFGKLAEQGNMPVGKGGPFGPVSDTGMVAEIGSYFAFGVLPTIIFFSSLMAVLYHLGVMQLLVRGVAWVMQRTMGTSGSETLSAAGNIFVGQTEAPLLVRPFVPGMTESELMAVMTGGFATVAGGVMAAYVGLLSNMFAGIAGHLISASVMSAPAALVCAKLLIPEPVPEKSETYGELKLELKSTDANLIDAAARGAGDGLKLALNVGAMVLAFVALIAMANKGLGWAGEHVFGTEGLTLQLILGKLLAPVAWLLGVPWEDCGLVGRLIGIKTVVNEFVAYIDLSTMLGPEGGLKNPRSVVIATYALCGFANFGSIAIQIGGIGGIAPERRGDLAKLGLRAMIAGTIAAFLTATVAGLMV